MAPPPPPPRRDPSVRGSLPEFVGHPEPLATRSPEWTAYLDCSLAGTDADTAVGQLCLDLGCTGLTVTTVPHTVGTGLEDPGRYGAVQMSLYGPLRTGFLNQVRTLSVAHDGSRWRFDADGTPQDFETPAAYSRRKIRDRLTSDLLDQYCAALGVRPFDETFHGPDALLVTSDAPAAPDGKVLRLPEAQAWFGIRPGAGDSLPG